MSTLLVRPEVSKEDVPALPMQYQRQAVRALLSLRDSSDPEHPDGFIVRELFATHVNLDLTGCFALYFGGEAYPDSFRLVYRVVAEGVEVIAVGPRMASAVYRAAQERLQPQPVRTRRRRTYPMDHNVNRRS